MKHLFQAIHVIYRKQCYIRDYYMPGAGGIACAVLNFRRLGFSSCAQDTVYVVHSFKVDFGKILERGESRAARRAQGRGRRRGQTRTQPPSYGSKKLLEIDIL